MDRNESTTADLGETSNTDASGETIDRLEQALSRETAATQSLRDDLARLQEEVASIRASFRQQLEAATDQRRKAEAMLMDQAQRLKSLGAGREATMRELQRVREELARVGAERDRLQKDLAAQTGMQTETIALPDDVRESQPGPEILPSLEELMSSLGTMQEADVETEADEVEAEPAEAPDAPELISPELVFVADDFSDDAAHAETLSGDGAEAPPAPAAARPQAGNSSVLVFLDSDPPIKYPLFKPVNTIGRSDAADIRVDGDFISRIHARVIVKDGSAAVEDAGSKNGIEVNYKPVLRQRLKHGDVLSLGTVHFTYLDLG